MRKRILSVFMALCLTLTLMPTAFAAGPTEEDLITAEQWKDTFDRALNNGSGDVDWDTLFNAVGSYSVVKGQTAIEGVNNAETRIEALKTYYEGITTLSLAGKQVPTGDQYKGLLAELTGLETLDLSDTGIDGTFFGAMIDLSLTSLDISGNQAIESADGLMFSGSNATTVANSLTSLDISGTGITTMNFMWRGTGSSGTAAISGLKTLTAQDLELTSIAGLVEIVNAGRFSASGITWDLSGSTLTAGGDNAAHLAALKTAFADSNGYTAPITAGDAVFRVGATEYAVLSEAVDAANAQNAPLQIIGSYTPDLTEDGMTLATLNQNIVIAGGGVADLSDLNSMMTLANFTQNVEIQAGGTLMLPGSKDLPNTTWFGGSDARMDIQEGSVTISGLNDLASGGCAWTLSDGAVVEIPAGQRMNLQLNSSGVKLEIPENAVLNVKGTLRGVSGGENPSEIEVNGTLNCEDGLLSLSVKPTVTVGATGTLAIGDRGVSKDTDGVQQADTAGQIILTKGGSVTLTANSAWKDNAATGIRAEGTNNLFKTTDASGNVTYGSTDRELTGPIIAYVGANEPYDDLSEAMTAAKDGTDKTVTLVAASVTLDETDEAIPTGVTLVVPTGVTLTIPADKAIAVLGTSQGILSVEEGGKLSVAGIDMIGDGNHNLQVLGGSVDMDLSKVATGGPIDVTINGSAAVPSGKYWTTTASSLGGVKMGVTVASGSTLTVNGEFRVANGTWMKVDNGGGVTVGGVMSVRSQGQVSASGKITVIGVLALCDEGTHSATVSPHTSIVLSNNGYVLSQSERQDIPNSQRVPGTFTQAFTDGAGTETLSFDYKYIYQEPVNPNPPTPVQPGGSTSGGSTGGSSSSGELVTVDRTTGGSVQVRPGRAESGETVTITATPNEGYEVGSVTVTDRNGREISVRSEGNNRYTFTMPSTKVDVDVDFVRIGAAQPQTGFRDVSASAYYYDAVAWAVEQGVTTGTTATTFSPDSGCTRAQIVTFLWRANGSPAPRSASNPFTDVSPSAYYYDAVLWAVEEGITSGATATTFNPNGGCTRAQAATFLWRSEGSPVAGGSGFSDVSDGAYYAGAVDWAVANGVTNGVTATTFGPNNPCTRAQIVTFLYRALA